MSDRFEIGWDVSKWCIVRSPAPDGEDTKWAVLPPLVNGRSRSRGAYFPSGAEALAAFAKGGAK